MGETKKSSCNGIVFLVSCLALWTVMAAAEVQKHLFVLGSTRVTRLCKTQNVITVNGQFPGPTLEVRNGDTLEVLVKNNAKYNATVHWHGVRQFRTGWADGPEFITQCPIRPGGSYTYRFTIQGQEGTLFWHAHSSWLRATVYGALIIYPSRTVDYPFRKPIGETPIVLGEWWNANPIDVINAASRTGAAPNMSDAFTINGQPGDLYPCSSKGTFKLQVRQGEMHMLRVINAAVATELFFAVADHTLTVIATDANYAKPFKTNVILLGPGQTSDVLITADQSPSNRYYMSSRAYSAGQGVPFDNTTTTAILEYIPSRSTTSTPKSPALPAYNDTGAFTQFSQGIRSLASAAHPSHVPKILDEDLFYTVGLGILPCPKGRTCGAPNNTIFAASMNNVSFVLPSTLSILQAHTQGVKGVFTAGFPDAPAKVFDYTGQNISRSLFAPLKDTKVKILKYNASVQVVLQGTNIFAGESHPIHLHGYDFFIVGSGFGNFNAKKDTKNFNLVDPAMRNTVNVPKNGWAAIRFYADNPGAWIMHCHLDQHLGWGLAMVFVVENGQGEMLSIEPPPQDLPAC